MFKHLDIVIGVVAWSLGAGIIFGNHLWLPGDSFDYQFYYFPFLWLVAILLLPVVRKRPWRRLWWVWPSVLPVLGILALLLYLMFISRAMDAR